MNGVKVHETFNHQSILCESFRKFRHNRIFGYVFVIKKERKNNMDQVFMAMCIAH